MKFQSLLVISIICFFCTGVMAEDAAVVTGLCKDGTPYTGKSKRGACRGHDGVKEWYGEKGAAATTTATTTSTPAPAPVATTPAVAATPVTEAKPASAATGICKDGSEYTGKTKRGACRGHGGVKDWFADKSPVAEAAPAPVQPAPAPAVEPTTVTPAAAPAVAPTAQSSAPNPAAVVQAPPAGAGMVWANTHSKIYHCEGSKFYGKTKQGEFMTEADAQAKGFVANRKKICNK